ncbi:DUF934 domain-containing protein [Halomonas sp. FeN2]|uniref:DUF934 domain-containing protein n=1 Tax=Halomonadaceae TaxID=28256 RepID=UPI000C5D6E1B|nr:MULTISPECIES: DUF934 domain-containing protein [unclassified Halomonas]MBF57126.1 hypothetical protein [Halomonas sp.]TDV94782.1 uncharacterized protein (DUF934 family) [Halomonas alkaliantarctica]UBR50075.1 DUF934 domain-containing protein [Halomonas sp. FeN2]|tara:strand:+ start:1379 stop:1942 length:564 start_codon:yes stop_codon:yes gene_type:complete
MPNNPVPNKTDETQTEAVEQTPVHVDHLIANGELAAENAWCVSYDADALPEQRPAFVPLALWQANQEDAELAPLLTSDTELTAELGKQLGNAPAIAIDFPAFTDGRGYSIARLLRERYGYSGEVRAVGDVLVDQLEYMRRCGFTAMALRDDQHPEDALRALSFFSVRYQPDVEERQALFERRLADNK